MEENFNYIPSNEEVHREMTAQRKKYRKELPVFSRVSKMHKKIRGIFGLREGNFAADTARCLQAYIFYIVVAAIIVSIYAMNPVTILNSDGSVNAYSGPGGIVSYDMGSFYTSNGIEFTGAGPAPTIKRTTFSNGNIKYTIEGKKVDAQLQQYSLDGSGDGIPNWDGDTSQITTVKGNTASNSVLLTNPEAVQWGVESATIHEETHLSIFLVVIIGFGLLGTLALAIFTEDDTEEIDKIRKNINYFKSTNTVAFNKIKEAMIEARKNG
ncbi:MAG: hypothetical protein ACRCWG_04230 [Sarcina sp.]